jgi:hypothetical protein
MKQLETVKAKSMATSLALFFAFFFARRYFGEEDEAARKYDEAAALTGAPLNFPAASAAAALSAAVSAPTARLSARRAGAKEPQAGHCTAEGALPVTLVLTPHVFS